MIYSVVGKNRADWPKHLPACAFAYRTSVVEGLGFTPFQLVYGREAVQPLQLLYGDTHKVAQEAGKYHSDLLQSFTKTYHATRAAQTAIDAKNKQVYDRTHVHVTFEVGQPVLLWTPPRAKPGEVTKFLPRYTGTANRFEF